MRWLAARLAGMGLRWRLAGWVVAVILACLGVAFVAVYRGTGTQVGHQIDTEIAVDSGQFAHSLALADPDSPAQAAAAASRYVRSQPFSPISTLLFAVIPGVGTRTNSPEFFQDAAPDQGESAAEQRQENRLATRLLTVRDGYRTLQLPDVGNLRLLKRTVRLPGVRGPAYRVVIGVGESLAPVVSAQRGVGRAFILAGILALLGALTGAYLIGTRVSRPLRRMATVAARVDAGDLAPRIHEDSRSHEIRVMVDAFNHMLDRLTDAFAGQRAFVADASHELRTPLTVIRGQLEVLSAQENPSPQEMHRVERLVQAEIARISRLVDDLLLLTKAEQAEFLRPEPIELRAFVSELWHASTTIADRCFELQKPIPSGTLLADPDRLAQALRNLITNAIAHTVPGTGLVCMRVVGEDGDRIRFFVEDDGPGIPPDQRERVFDRFHRTDTARDRASGGTGLGLAIVDAIAKAHGGRVSANESSLGGASLELELPRFTPVPDRTDGVPLGPRRGVREEGQLLQPRTFQHR